MSTAAADEALAGWSVSELLRAARDRVATPAPIEGWVVGCISGLRRSRGHLFFDLADADGVEARQTASVPVAVLGRAADRVLATLARAEVELSDGLQVRLWGRLELYAPRARLELLASAIDPATTVGAAALARRRLIRRLRAEHLLEANGRCVLPALPLRVGIVGPAGAGRRDVLAALDGSGYAWHLTCATATTQGPAAAAAIAWGVGAAWRAGVDLVLVVRGGGAALDLSAFDDERVARAVARCPRPVWTAVGHTGDRSVADACAQRSFPTPSAAASALVEIAGSVEAGLDDAVSRVGRDARRVVDTRASQLESSAAALGERARALVDGRSASLDLLETAIDGLARARAADHRTRVMTIVAVVAVLFLAALVLWMALRGVST